MLRALFLPLAAASLFLAACQTSQLRQYEKLHAGMDKHEVLETMGSPMTSNRMHDKDRWIYVFYDNGIRFEKEVHFMSGNVVYVGEPWTPAPEKTAISVDKKNEEINKVEDAKEEKREEARKGNANAYLEYEKEVHDQGDKVKYLPSFESK